MRYPVVLALFFASSAYAQLFGTGQVPGQQCPYNFGQGQGATNPRDPVSNLQSKMRAAQGSLQLKEQKLERLNGYIKRAKQDMRKVIKSDGAISEIERHYKFKAGADSYQNNCVQSKKRSGSAGGQKVNAVHHPARRQAVAGGNDSGRYPVPSEFCTYDEDAGKVMNDWAEIVAEDGKVMDEVCDYEVPVSRNQPDSSRVRACKRGLQKYYDKMAEREKVEEEIRDIKERMETYNDRAEKIQEQIAEGTYCPACAEQARLQQMQQGSAGLQPFMNQGISILLNFQNRQNQMARPMPPRYMPMVPRAPGIIRPGQPMPFPGPMAYPGRPYAAPVRGFSGIQPGFAPGQGYYGGAPGGIGPGAFGCQGTNTGGFGNPMAPQFMPFQNGGANPFANPFAVNPNIFNPNFQHSMLNPGYGPGFGPQLGNGVYDPFNNFGRPPGTLPWMGNNAANYNNYYGNPFANPFAPFGNSYSGPSAFPYGQAGGFPPSTYPWNGNLGYGGPQYNLGASIPPIVNMPYGYGGNYGPTPVTNLNWQMGLLKNQMSAISGFGAPAILPAPITGTPIYNNPVPAVPPPMPAPVGGAPSVVRPIR